MVQICTQTPKKEEEEEEEEEKQLIPTKKYVAGIHVQAHIRAHTRPQHHKYPNNLKCFFVFKHKSRSLRILHTCL